MGFGGGPRLQVRIGSWDYRSGVGVWLYEMKPNGDIYVAEMTANGLLFKHAGNGAMAINPNPTFSIPAELAADFRKGMAEALSEWGVENESESKVAGKLAATERHLEDMRSLVFHKLPKLSTESTGLST